MIAIGADHGGVNGEAPHFRDIFTDHARTRLFGKFVENLAEKRHQTFFGGFEKGRGIYDCAAAVGKLENRDSVFCDHFGHDPFFI